MSKFTPWFSGAVAPVHAGVYQRRYLFVESWLDRAQKFAKFDEGRWFVGCATVREAAAERFPSLATSADFQWRGLAEEQSNV